MGLALQRNPVSCQSISTSTQCLFMTVESITASEYMRAKENAARNAADMPALRRVEEELNRLPKTQERLVIDLLKVARAALDRGKNLGEAALPAIDMGRSLGLEKQPKYLEAIEDIAVRCFESMPKCVDSRFTLTFVSSLFVLRTSDKQRLNILLDKLKRSLGHADYRCDLLALAEESEEQMRERDRELRRRIDLQLSEYCQFSRLQRN